MAVKHNKKVIYWDKYKPSKNMQTAVNKINKLTYNQLLDKIPEPEVYKSKFVKFDYRIFSKYKLSEVEKVYVLINGFAERASTPDSGVKGLLVDQYTRQIDKNRYAILVVGGLYSFPAKQRNIFLKQGFGALNTVADEISLLVKNNFPSLENVTVSGYSLGGVLSPLTARSIFQNKVARVDMVNSGEPNYVLSSTSRRDLLKRVSRASAYRNDQIKATDINSYIAVKKLPENKRAMILYRAKQYKPLIRDAASMRFVARDLALQALNYNPKNTEVQFSNALEFLAESGARVNLLRAEHSIICNAEAFESLLEKIPRKNNKFKLVLLKGDKADHGIEEQRVLSTPFLIEPDSY